MKGAMVIKLDEILDSFQFSEEDSHLIQMALGDRLRALQGYNDLNESISMSYLCEVLLGDVIKRFPNIIQLIRAEYPDEGNDRTIDVGLDILMAANNLGQGDNGSNLLRNNLNQMLLLKHISHKEFEVVMHLLQTIERMKRSMDGHEGIQVQLKFNKSIRGQFENPLIKRLIVLDLDNTFICAAYRDHPGHDLLFSYSEFLRVYTRPYAKLLVLLFALLGEVIVSTTAKRKYAKKVCENLFIPFCILKTRGTCRMERGEYRKSLESNWTELYDEIWIIEDNPSVWKGVTEKVKMLKVGEFLV